MPPQPEPVDETNDGEGRLLADIEQQNRLISGLIRTEVDNELREARAQMTGDPAQVEQGLKLMLERVGQAPELKAEVRAQLRGQLETACAKPTAGGHQGDHRSASAKKPAPRAAIDCRSPMP